MDLTLQIKAVEIVNELQARFEFTKVGRPKDKRIVVFAILQGGSQIRLETVAYSGSETIIVQGFDSDNKFVEVVMHYSTFQFKLFLVNRDPGKKQEEIKFGFQGPENK